MIGQPPPPIDAHTKVKHQLVFDYVRQYITVLMSNANIPALNLSLVDGFAGGGNYTDPDSTELAPGSPLLLLQAVKEATALINVGRANPRQVNAQYFFVDSKKKTTDHLQNVLRAEGYEGSLGRTIGIQTASFDHVCGSVVDAIKARKSGERAIFLLDQYAYQAVPMQMVRGIFENLQGAEVILTFNVDSLLAFLTDSPSCRKTMASIGLEEHINWKDYEALKKTSAWRPIIQQQLSNGIYKATGAKFMTLFFVTPLGDTPWSYWLVHLSNKLKAHDVMMDLHWQSGNSFGHSLEPGIFKVGYEANADESATGQAGFKLGDAFAFDAVLREKCVDSLAGELPRIFYAEASKDGVAFSDVMHGIANRTTATADIVKESLDLAVRTGDLKVVSPEGVERKKGSSIRDSDIITLSKQQSIFLPAPVTILKRGS